MSVNDKKQTSCRFGRVHFSLGFINLRDDQLGLGYRPPHEVMDAQVAGYFISSLCVSRSKLAHFCPVMTRHDGALIW